MFKDKVVALPLNSMCCYVPNLQSRDLAGVHFTFHFMQQFISDETKWYWYFLALQRLAELCLFILAWFCC